MSAFFSLLALALLYPIHPVTVAGSIFWFLAVLPIYIIGEGITSLFVNEKVGRFINKNTSKTSVGRIGYGVLVMCVFLLIFGLFASVVGEGFSPFFENNFSDTWK